MDLILSQQKFPCSGVTESFTLSYLSPDLVLDVPLSTISCDVHSNPPIARYLSIMLTGHAIVPLLVTMREDVSRQILVSHFFTLMSYLCKHNVPRGNVCKLMHYCSKHYNVATTNIHVWSIQFQASVHVASDCSGSPTST